VFWLEKKALAFFRRNLIYKWREQLNTKQDKALKRTANNADTPYHKAAHSELASWALWCGLLVVVSILGYLHTPT
jgi:hypothetical protein